MTNVIDCGFPEAYHRFKNNVYQEWDLVKQLFGRIYPSGRVQKVEKDGKVILLTIVGCTKRGQYISRIDLPDEHSTEPHNLYTKFGNDDHPYVEWNEELGSRQNKSLEAVS